MSWQTGLIKTILDPKNVFISTDVAVVIADKFPKARHHYLVLPKEDIASIFQVSLDNGVNSRQLLIFFTPIAAE